MSSEIPLEKKIRSQILDKNLNGKNIIRHHNFPIYSALLKLELKFNAQFYIVHFNNRVYQIGDNPEQRKKNDEATAKHKQFSKIEVILFI